MIQVYSSAETNYDNNGLAVLQPTQCTVREIAGGLYTLSLTHPIDPHGLWKTIQTGYIIKCPVPVQMTGNIVAGDKLDLYKVTSDAYLRAKPSSGSEILYPRWEYRRINPDGTRDPAYVVGDKVSYGSTKVPYKNYICIKDTTYVKNGLSVRRMTPNNPAAAEFWKEIPRYRDGGQILLTLKTGVKVYVLEDLGSWKRVATMAGVEGYVQSAQLTYDSTITSDKSEEHVMREQLFRVHKVAIDSSKHLLTAEAKHVFYDYSGDLINDCVVTAQPPGVALALIKENLNVPQEDHAIATNLTGAEEPISQDWSWTNFVNALLDPDTGLVPNYKAKLIRDNWDVYILKDDKTDRGMRLTYGSNLVGVNWTRSTEKLITRCVPVAKAADGKNLYLDELWIDSPIIDAYPVITMEKLTVNGQVGKDDGAGGTYTAESLTAYMREKAGKRFSEDDADKPTVTLRVDFVMLGDTTEFSQYRQLQKLYLYDMVSVYDPNIGLDTQLQVTETNWDAINLRYTGITLGDSTDYALRRVAGYELRNGCIQLNKLSQAAIDELKG